MTQFLPAVALLFALGVSLHAAPPNVVLIVPDDHGWTDYGFMRHPHVRTPHLDKLAAQSLVFPRGYVPTSLCCPSLASLVTGRYPHQHKVTGNDPPMPAGMTAADFPKSKAFVDGRGVMARHLEAVPTLPSLLAETALFGACFTHVAVALDDPTKNVRHRWAIDGNWKLIVPHVVADADRPGKVELYDLAADPHEKNDLAAARPAAAKALTAKLYAWWKPGE